MQFCSCWERVVLRLILVFSMYYFYLSFWLISNTVFEGKTLVLITPVPDHCYFFSYNRTLFAILFVHILNKFCICSSMLRIFWSFHDVFSKIVSEYDQDMPQSQTDKLSKATSSLFPIKMIAILEWT